MLATANRFYRADPQPFLLLTLDLDRTGSPWRFDDPGRASTRTSTGRSTPPASSRSGGSGAIPDGTFTAIDPR